MAVFHFIEGFYNNSRRHSAMVCLWSIGYEKEASCVGLTRPGRKLSPGSGQRHVRVLCADSKAG